MSAESNRTPPNIHLPHLPDWIPAERPKEGKIELYVKGQDDPSAVHHLDPVQDGFWNCYFVTGLIAVVRAHQRAHDKGGDDFVKNLIKKNEDGTYTVTFFDRTEPTGKLEVTVNTDFNPKGVKSDDVDERWPAVIEKAYIKAYGDGIDPDSKKSGGGNCAQVMERLTGLQSRAFDLGVKPYLPPNLAYLEPRPPSLDALAAYQKEGYAITLMSFRETDAGAQQPAYNEAKYAYQLEKDHAYVVTNVDVQKKEITINNYAHPKDFRGDIKVPYDQLETLFAQAQANPVKQETK